MKKHLWIPAAAALVVAVAAGSAPPSPSPVDVKRDHLFEITVTPSANQEKGAPLQVRASFTAPSGSIINIGGFEDGGRVRFRFAPRELGLYHYVVEWQGRTLARGELRSTPAPKERGYVRRDPRDPHQLAFDDGTPFRPIGENRFNVYDPSWNYQNQSIEQYLASMKANGENTLRLFVINDCEDEERADRVQPGCLETAPGRFSSQSAALYDRIVDAATKNGVYVIFGVWAIGFTPHETWKSWEDNPYSTARGGPAKTPEEFFTRADVRQLAVKKLEYIAARWGWSPHVLAVDLVNEPEWDGPIAEDVWVPWAEEMARAWRRVDAYQHLITAGPVGLAHNIRGDERPWYASPECDVVQFHLYGKEFYEVHALADEMHRRVDEVWSFDKPVLVGEFGWGGEAKPLYDHTHVGLWTALLSGAGALMHSAPPFNLDSDEPMTPERGTHPAVLSRFLAELDPAPHQPRTLTATPSGTRAFALVGPRDTALWLLAPEASYGRPLDGARVTLELPPALYRVDWIDDVTGAPRGQAVLDARVAGPVTLAVPRFSRHLAARVHLQPDAQIGSLPNGPIP